MGERVHTASRRSDTRPAVAPASRYWRAWRVSSTTFGSGWRRSHTSEWSQGSSAGSTPITATVLAMSGSPSALIGAVNGNLKIQAFQEAVDKSISEGVVMDITAITHGAATQHAPAPAIPVDRAAANREVIQAVKALNGTE